MTARHVARLARFFTIVIGVVSFTAASLISQTSGGSPDPSFSGDGYIGENCPSAGPLPGSCNSPATAMAIQPDGRFVLASGGSFRVWRYTADGQRDTPWSSQSVDFGIGSTTNDVVLQPDNKIVAVGHANGTGFALARYLPDLTLDTSFSDDGILVIPMGYGPNGAASIVIQPDGSWLIGGWAAWVPESVRQFALTRVLPTGQVDASFGTNGRVYVRFLADAIPNRLAVDSQGRIVMSGLIAESGDFPRAIAAVRYLPDGSVDTSFGVEGRVIIRGPQVIAARGLAVQGDDRIVVGGTAGVPGNGESRRFVLIRWTQNGVLDSSFGAGGIVSTVFPSGASELNALVIQPDGKIVAGGQAQGMALARYLADGTLDSGFGVNGLVTGFSTYINDLLIQPDAKIVAAGARVTSSSPFCPGGPCGGGPMPAMARYLP